MLAWQPPPGVPRARATDPQCDQCWCVIHLKCIHQWIKKLSESGGGECAWTCPNCRYHRVSPLPRYKCFCQKVLEPEASPHWLAHSCGEVCGRDRGCPHPCPELCHPGPCPPCTAVGSAGQCHCGREHRERMRCGDPARWSCGDTCGRPLGCGEHTCPLRCHPGPCPPCKVTVLQRCHCGAEQRQGTCGQGGFACAGVCGRALRCGDRPPPRRAEEGEGPGLSLNRA
ncbi:unnamed protein product [Prorocentrum cordatum]|uniref:NF-X1-type domain-containing protein n=1 Tax=Prorocentrum cordatum TaxID=2364126 RepID=A0ABN9VD62_9DINO|nr:unnamed protein product [Polarella glacialis]